MDAYNSDQDSESNHCLKLDHKVESDQNTNSKELQGVVPDTPHKKLARRLQKPKKKTQRTKGCKDQLKVITRILDAIQEQTALINQKCERQAINIGCLTQKMKHVNQELLTQRKRTRHIEDHLHKDKGPKKVKKRADVVNKQTTKSEDDEKDDGERYSDDKQRCRVPKKSERNTLKTPILDVQCQITVEYTPSMHPPLTAEIMTTLIKETMAVELGTIRQRMNQMDKGNLPYIPDLGSEEHPLPYTEAIMSGKTSKKKKFQKIDVYDGSTDPYDHLDNFRSAMDGKDATEADRCKAFPQTLKGSALNWFRHLPTGTIQSFGDMRRIFLDEFMIVSNRIYTPNDLTQIRQLPEETLRDYVIRFQGDYHRCEGADEKIAYAALMGGFRSGPFLFKIMQDPPSSFKALIREATNYSRAENLNHTRGLDINLQPSTGTKRNSSTAFKTETFSSNSNATLSSSAVPHIIGIDTARDVWLALERRFTSMSNFNIMKLRSDLQTITKGSDSIDVYMGKVEGIRTKLGLGFSVTVDDAELIAHALRGLPDEYEAFRNSITARIEPLQTTEFHLLLRAEESSILAGSH